MESERSKIVVEEVERTIASPGKLKILRLLMKNPTHAFTRYEVGKKIALSPVDIKKDLTLLVETGWVKETRLAHLQKYSINLDNELTKEFTVFFKRIGYV
jgi:response regulator of citrate/malate metabolism